MNEWVALKRLCAGPPQYGLNVSASEYKEEGTRLLRTTDLGRPPDENAVFVSSHLVTERHRLRDGDILFSRSGTLGRSSRYQAAGGSATFAGYLVRFRPGDRAEPRYLSYCADARFFGAAIEADAVTSTISNFNAERYGNVRVPAHPLSVQRAIADFLDAETARIDALVAKKRSLIAVLDERRQAAIDLALTNKGQMVRLRHLIDRLTSGPRGWAEFAADEGTLFLRITNVASDDIELRMHDTVRVQAPDGAERVRTMVRKGDVLISITAEIGSVGVARSEHDGAAVSQHVALMTPRGCSGDWIALSLCTTSARAQLDASQYGGTKTQLALDDVRDLRLWTIPRGPEASVLEDLGRRLAALRSLKQKLDRQIELLCEHRQALITAAVTGELAIP